MCIENTCFQERLLRCWCFDCNKIFLIDGDSPIGSTVCIYCTNKNYDFDLNFRYSRRKKVEIVKRIKRSNECLKISLSHRKINVDRSARFFTGSAFVKEFLIDKSILRLFPKR